MLAGGAAAAAWPGVGLSVGARADLLLLNVQDDALRGLPGSQLLDGLVFAAPARPFARVMAAGRWVVLDDAARGARFEAAMRALWGAGG